jgi:hypothetical protein
MGLTFLAKPLKARMSRFLVVFLPLPPKRTPCSALSRSSSLGMLLRLSAMASMSPSLVPVP